MAGALIVVGTPIGNLGDLSPRAAQELAQADLIACEDSRRTGRLLSLSGINAPRLMVVNEYTEVDRIDQLLDHLARGERVVLVSDAGMPTVSDPGRRVVAAVTAAGYRVEAVPGPVAAATALSVSGMRADRFVFEGFLPRKGTARAERLASVAAEERTVVLYESPHRLARTLCELAACCEPERRAVLARELTKLHEEIIGGTLDELSQHVARLGVKGELVLVVEGAQRQSRSWDDETLEQALETALDRGISRRDAVIEVVATTGEPKRRIYDLAVRLRDGDTPGATE